MSLYIKSVISDLLRNLLKCEAFILLSALRVQLAELADMNMVKVVNK